MGGDQSLFDYDQVSLRFYHTALRHECLLPNVGIDDSLWKYSGLDSNAVLKEQSSLLTTLPSYTQMLGTNLAALSSVPNAVGLGALVIALIIEVILKTNTNPNDQSYAMFRRVFGEEKASSVRDTISEYLMTHRAFMNNEQRLQTELRRLEGQLRGHLIILRNSLLYDRQMSSRGLKIWVNGASFQIQMLIHEARLKSHTGEDVSNHLTSIHNFINEHLRDLEKLRNTYKTYKIGTTRIYRTPTCSRDGCYYDRCMLGDSEANCQKQHYQGFPCDGSRIVNLYVDHVFSKYEPLLSLKNYFLDVQRNLNTVIHQHHSFNLS
ncbi:hypothetical protein JOB18_041748 [Solea senegalensis]|uniref:Uncharacterized protein n=1 Tax=Solea senegalensis TaxID=28829 RepID=A0AAV6QMX4_SOLSE|nr:hypothetical protein JOB18_041748 [Solea senegalensis]